MKIALKLAAAAACSFLLWEAVLANAMLGPTGSVNDPVLGLINRPGTYVFGTEGYSRSKVNSLGFRGDELAAKQPGEYRILALGDSFTEAYQVAERDSFVNRLQDELGPSRVHVINGGRSGDSPASYIHLADYYKERIAPDYTIVQINEGDFTVDLLNPARQFYVAQDGAAYKTVFQSGGPGLRGLLIDKFPQFSWVLKLSVFWIGTDKGRALLQGAEAGEEAALPAADPESLVWTLEELKRKYGNVVLLYIPLLDYSHLDAPPSATEQLVAATAARSGLELVNPRAAFAADFAATRQPLHGFDNTIPGSGHLNARGHELVAKELAAYFERGMLP